MVSQTFVLACLLAGTLALGSVVKENVQDAFTIQGKTGNALEVSRLLASAFDFAENCVLMLIDVVYMYESPIGVDITKASSTVCVES